MSKMFRLPHAVVVQLSEFSLKKCVHVFQMVDDGLLEANIKKHMSHSICNGSDTLMWSIVLEAFASFRGPDFYGLPRNQDTVTLIEEPWDIPMTQAFGEDELIPIRAGESIRWSVKG